MKSESKKLMCLDITMRWNSSYMILEAAEFNEKVFDWVRGRRSMTLGTWLSFKKMILLKMHLEEWWLWMSLSMKHAVLTSQLKKHLKEENGA